MQENQDIIVKSSTSQVSDLKEENNEGNLEFRKLLQTLPVANIS